MLCRVNREVIEMSQGNGVRRRIVAALTTAVAASAATAANFAEGFTQRVIAIILVGVLVGVLAAVAVLLPPCRRPISTRVLLYA
jgi:hypothetical protein